MMDINPVPPIAITAFLVAVIGLIMAGSKGKLTETRLILLGIFLAVSAVLYDALLPTVSMGRANMPNIALATGQATGGLLRIGFLLVLGGVAGYLWKECGHSATPKDGGAPDVR